MSLLRYCWISTCSTLDDDDDVVAVVDFTIFQSIAIVNCCFVLNIVALFDFCCKEAEDDFDAGGVALLLLLLKRVVARE